MLMFITTVKNEEIRTQLEEIFLLYNKDLWHIANEILNDMHEAEDVVQTAYEKFYNYLDRNIDIKCNKTMGLIVIIVRSIAINLFNQRKRRTTVDISELEDVLHDGENTDPVINVLRVDKRLWIARQLAKIKPEYADVLSLKYEYGYSDKDIAELCGINEGNVRARLARAKKAIYGIVEGETYE
jgi:RNA polymerase sigma-70 factor, ECF subfamily